MAYDFSTPNSPNQWGLGNNGSGLNFGSGQDLNSMNNWGFQMPNAGALNPLTGNGSNSLALPNTAGAAGWGGIAGLGANIDTAKLGLGALGSLTSLYTGLKSLGIARDSLDFQKNLASTNLANSTQSYNTALTDKATSRGVAEGQTPAQVASYVSANKLAG